MPSLTLDGKEVEYGGTTGWPAPREFRNLHWEGGVATGDATAPAAMQDAVPQNLDETIQKAIKQSTDLEKRDKANR